MRARTPILMCDADDGGCDAWQLDYYAQTASSVDGTRITTTERAPRWTSTRLEDFCPKHKPAVPSTTDTTKGSTQ